MKNDVFVQNIVQNIDNTKKIEYTIAIQQIIAHNYTNETIPDNLIDKPLKKPFRLHPVTLRMYVLSSSSNML